MEASEFDATRPRSSDPSLSSSVVPLATSTRGGGAFRVAVLRLEVCFFFFCANASGDGVRSRRARMLATRRVADDFIGPKIPFPARDLCNFGATDHSGDRKAN